MKQNYWDLKKHILSEIKTKGGWVNCHAHIDRAFTITKENFALSNHQRHEKWLLNNELKEKSSVQEIYERMVKATERMLEQGVTALGSYIDVDHFVQDKSIQAAQKLRDTYKGQMQFRFMNQSSYGLFNKKMESQKWFNEAVQFVDIIGGLLKADKGREDEHLDILFDTANKFDKSVNIHLDELNTPEEKETELVVKKMKQHNMQGKVTGVHGISINCHPKEYRNKLYQSMKKVDMKYISCPVSWLNARRSEVLAPTHNPITPFDEMRQYDIPVGIGSDNIADIWMPFSDADMWLDLRILFEATRCHDLDAIINIATVNGRKVLGLDA